jgi:hypothetical protein
MFWFESSIQAMTPYFLVGRGLVLFAGAFGMFSLRTTRVKGLAAIRRGYDYELLVASGICCSHRSCWSCESIFSGSSL